MSLPRKSSEHFLRIAASVLLTLSLAGCAGGSSDTVKTVVIENDRSSAPAATTAGTDIDGDWYGWWRMYSTSGDWARMYNYWWDCCAEIKDGHMLLWDEDMPKDTFLSEAELSVRGRDISCVGGTFLDGELDSSSWDLTLSEDSCGAFMTVSGKYTAVGRGGFSYEIYLRPWGSKWPEDDKNKLPYYYKDWYLPLIDAGEDMPDIIGSKD